MTLDLVLNELSLQTPAEDIPTARQRMSELIQTLREAITHGASRALRTTSDLHDILIAPEYPVRRWRNDSGVEREQQSYFRTLTSKTPPLVDIPERESDFQGIECWCHGVQATGFGVAFLLAALPVSIPSEPCWDASHILLNVTQLDTDGELVNEEVSIVHASRPTHVRFHSEWLQGRLKQIAELQKKGIRSGADLWRSRAEMFPSLVFCACVHTQVEVLLSGDSRLQHIIRLLKELDSYTREWQERREAFNAQRLPGNPSQETVSTRQRYGTERTFICPDDV